LFPVIMYNEVEGWVARRTDKAPPGRKLKTPYRNAEFMSSRDVVFPLDVVAKMNRRVLVLVEGPYDAIRLINYGIPALAMLGTRNYHPDNRIHMMNAGAETIILAMDSDDAGRSVRAEISLSLKEMFNVVHFNCPEGRDPGDMPLDHLEKLLYVAQKEHRKLTR
jgi:DNA primase